MRWRYSQWRNTWFLEWPYWWNCGGKSKNSPKMDFESMEGSWVFLNHSQPRNIWVITSFLGNCLFLVWESTHKNKTCREMLKIRIQAKFNSTPIAHNPELPSGPGALPRWSWCPQPANLSVVVFVDPTKWCYWTQPPHYAKHSRSDPQNALSMTSLRVIPY